jgi:hypothetical protein
MGAILKQSHQVSDNPIFGLKLSTIFSDVQKEFNEHFNEMHEQLSGEIPYIRHKVRFSLLSGNKMDGSYAVKSALVNDISLRYAELLSPLDGLDVLERLLKVGDFIENHRNADKSKYLLDRYKVARSLIQECAERRGFDNVDLELK